MRKVIFFILALSLIFFSCKSKPEEKETQPVEQVVEEPEVKETVEPTQATSSNEFVIACPADMQKVDVLMAGKLDEVAEAIKTTKPETVSFVGHTAKLNTAREEELAVKKAVRLVVGYLEDIGALDDVKINVDNKGASEPQASHNDITARGKNRRVVITLR